jgi:hypothetical protein
MMAFSSGASSPRPTSEHQCEFTFRHASRRSILDPTRHPMAPRESPCSSMERPLRLEMSHRMTVGGKSKNSRSRARSTCAISEAERIHCDSRSKTVRTHMDSAFMACPARDRTFLAKRPHRYGSVSTRRLRSAPSAERLEKLLERQPLLFLSRFTERELATSLCLFVDQEQFRQRGCR